MIIRVNVVLNKAIADTDCCFDNLAVVIFRVKVSCIMSLLMVLNSGYCQLITREFQYHQLMWYTSLWLWGWLPHRLSKRQSIGWFSNKTGMSVDNSTCKSSDWLDQWQSGKLSTGSHVLSFLHAFPTSNDVPVLLLNQPNVNNRPLKDQVHPDDHAQPTYEVTPGFKLFTV